MVIFVGSSKLAILLPWLSSPSEMTTTPLPTTRAFFSLVVTMAVFCSIPIPMQAGLVVKAFLLIKCFVSFFLNNLWREIIDFVRGDVYFRGPDMMIELNYRFKDISGNFRNFILFQYPDDELWCVRDEQVLLARLSRIHGASKQLSGEALPKGFIQSAGAFI